MTKVLAGKAMRQGPWHWGLESDVVIMRGGFRAGV